MILSLFINLVYEKKNWILRDFICFGRTIVEPFFGISENAYVQMLSGRHRLKLIELDGHRIIVKWYRSFDGLYFLIAQDLGDKKKDFALTFEMLKAVLRSPWVNHTLTMPMIAQETKMNVLKILKDELCINESKISGIVKNQSLNLEHMFQTIRFNTSLVGSNKGPVYHNDEFRDRPRLENEIVINTPFNYYVIHRRTGAILFSGRYAQPEQDANTLDGTNKQIVKDGKCSETMETIKSAISYPLKHSYATSQGLIYLPFRKHQSKGHDDYKYFNFYVEAYHSKEVRVEKYLLDDPSNIASLEYSTSQGTLESRHLICVMTDGTLKYRRSRKFVIGLSQPNTIYVVKLVPSNIKFYYLSVNSDSNDELKRMEHPLAKTIVLKTINSVLMIMVGINLSNDHKPLPNITHSDGTNKRIIKVDSEGYRNIKLCKDSESDGFTLSWDVSDPRFKTVFAQIYDVNQPKEGPIYTTTASPKVNGYLSRSITIPPTDMKLVIGHTYVAILKQNARDLFHESRVYFTI